MHRSCICPDDEFCYFLLLYLYTPCIRKTVRYLIFYNLKKPEPIFINFSKKYLDNPESLFTKADRTYDRTAVVRHASQLRYNLFTERVASDNRIV